MRELPMQGRDLLLGNDLAGGKVHVYPVVSESPMCDPNTEKLSQRVPGILPSCVVTRSQKRREKESPESDDLDYATLAGTFMQGTEISSGKWPHNWNWSLTKILFCVFYVVLSIKQDEQCEFR